MFASSVEASPSPTCGSLRKDANIIICPPALFSSRNHCCRTHSHFAQWPQHPGPIFAPASAVLLTSPGMELVTLPSCTSSSLLCFWGLRAGLPVCRALNRCLFHPDLWSWISSHPLLQTADSLPSLVPKTCYFSATSMVYCDTRCVLSPFLQSDGRTF